jgi:outer membrane protein assembly factor BamB
MRHDLSKRPQSLLVIGARPVSPTLVALLAAILLPLSACGSTITCDRACEPALPPSPYFIYANAIVSVGGAVYVDYQNVTNRSTASIAAFRVDNGTPLWKRSDPLNGAGLISDGDQVILVGLGGLDALRASDGTILWQATYDTPAASYVLQADTLYGVSTAIGDGANPYSAIGYFAVNLADGKLLWSMTIPTFIIPGIANQTLSGPVVSGNAMYFGTANGVVIAVRASDGVML